ncbi:unnamed protein product [Dovyalis caffra]|uniref:WRC domain-containing protein n=1 Tax=Dovyalis caffra TaxID=77055 RepID=A0AAV1S0H6_9ROSI|nr:unnamed protein product [Dovyalis caffra]
MVHNDVVRKMHVFEEINDLMALRQLLRTLNLNYVRGEQIGWLKELLEPGSIVSKAYEYASRQASIYQGRLLEAIRIYINEMRIRKLWRKDLHYHPYSTPLPPPDRVSSTHQAPNDDLSLDIVTIRRASFDSQEPLDHYRISPPFVDDTKKLTPHSCLSRNGMLYLQKNQRSFDPPPLMRSTINASICSDQNPEIFEEKRTREEKRSITPIHQSCNVVVFFVPVPTTPTDNDRRRSSSSSSTHSAVMSAESSVSSSLPSHGSWCEEDKVFPLKKRRISLERFISTQESSTVDKQKQNRKIAEMWASSVNDQTIYGKSKHQGEVEINSDQAMEEIDLMMRCSKVNGARWRCSTRKLEGHSLCKHHLNLQRMYDSRRFGGSYRLSNASNAAKDFRGSKKRKKVMISSILDRTVPLLATGDN